MRCLPRSRGCDGGTTAAIDASTDAPGEDATTDAASDATLALCQRTGLLFCEDLEALPLGAATNDTRSAWDTEAAAGQLAIDAAHARGSIIVASICGVTGIHPTEARALAARRRVYRFNPMPKKRT